MFLWPYKRYVIFRINEHNSWMYIYLSPYIIQWIFFFCWKGIMFLHGFLCVCVYVGKNKQPMDKWKFSQTPKAFMLFSYKVVYFFCVERNYIHTHTHTEFKDIRLIYKAMKSPCTYYMLSTLELYTNWDDEIL